MPPSRGATELRVLSRLSYVGACLVGVVTVWTGWNGIDVAAVASPSGSLSRIDMWP